MQQRAEIPSATAGRQQLKGSHWHSGHGREASLHKVPGKHVHAARWIIAHPSYLMHNAHLGRSSRAKGWDDVDLVALIYCRLAAIRPEVALILAEPAAPSGFKLSHRVELPRLLLKCPALCHSSFLTLQVSIPPSHLIRIGEVGAENLQEDRAGCKLVDPELDFLLRHETTHLPNEEIWDLDF